MFFNVCEVYFTVVFFVVKFFLVLNKIDQVDSRLAKIMAHKLFAVPISAQNQIGLEDLLVECEKMLW